MRVTAWFTVEVEHQMGKGLCCRIGRMHFLQYCRMLRASLGQPQRPSSKVHSSVRACCFLAHIFEIGRNHLLDQFRIATTVIATSIGPIRGHHDYDSASLFKNSGITWKNVLYSRLETLTTVALTAADRFGEGIARSPIPLPTILAYGLWSIANPRTRSSYRMV
jgi:hypothetical protein